MYEDFGAVVIDHTVEFRLFFPDNAKDPSQYTNGGLPRITSIRVTGDFQNKIGSTEWDFEHAPELVKTDHASGWLYTYKIDHLPDGYYQYKYFVTFENGTSRWCSDPCTKYVASMFENSAFVIGGNTTAVEPITERLPFRDLIIYELMIDDFTNDYRGTRAPVDAIRDRLDYLVNLGVNAVEFMPWTAWRGGAFSWGYDPFLFFAVENRYIEDPANPLDRLFRLKMLVKELHQRNIHVIMDGVFNHVSAGLTPDTSFPYHWLYQDPENSPFTGGFAGGGYFEDLDYNNGCTEQFIFDVCKFWLDVYQLDGIRFDYTLGFYLPQDLSKGIPKLVSDLKTHLQETNRKNVVLILEHLTDNRYEAIDATNRICGTGCWYDRFLFDVPDMATAGNLDTKLIRVLDTNRDFNEGKGPIPYIENHDHSTVVNRLGGRQRWWKSQPPLLALLTSPGAVMIHNGQEFGEDYFLPGEGADRVQSRPLHWDMLTDDPGQRLFQQYQHGIALRKSCPSLRSANFYPRFYDEQNTHFDAQGYGVDIDKDVVIYHRWGTAEDGRLERFIIILNFSDFDQYVDIPFSVNGVWEDRLNGDSIDVHNFHLFDQRINSNWGRLYYRKE
jgi:pullulanase